MATQPALDKLERAIGYCFRDRQLLLCALTHASHAYEVHPGPIVDNQRLEFLGDAVLGLLASEYLIRQYPQLREGELSGMKNFLVSASHLCKVAQSLDLGEYLLLGRGEELSGGRTKTRVLADALEALLAAIYLDSGLQAARSFAERHIFAAAAVEHAARDHAINFKGALQETARALKLPAPIYNVVAEQGPPHARRYTVEVRVGDQWTALGEGASKKDAGQKAARCLLERLVRERS